MEGTAHGLLLALPAIVAVACGTAAPPTSNPTSVPTQDAQLTPTPTPNIEATVEARLQARLADISTATPMPTPTPLPPNIFEELLGLIPDTPETRSQLWINDYAKASELSDISRGEPNSPPNAVRLYALGMAVGPFISGYTDYSTPSVENFRQYLGFDVRNIEQSVLVGVPPGQLEVVRGRFDPDTVDKTLRACSECVPHVLGEHRGVSFYSWGEDRKGDLQKRFSPPAFDWLGRGGRIAVQEKYIFRTVETTGMEALIDASLARRPSMADVEEFRLLARGMSELGAYTMFLTDMTQGWEAYGGRLVGMYLDDYATQAQSEGVMQEIKEKILLLRPYQAFATGAGKDAEGPYIALVLAHANPKSAAENVDRLRRQIEGTVITQDRKPWRPWPEVAEEIRAEGRVLLAKLRGQNWVGWVFAGEPRLLHE